MNGRIGLIVNSIAGMGGRVGLKGTDGTDILREARARGAVPVAEARAGRALAALAERSGAIEIVTFSSAMGEDAARSAGLVPRIAGAPENPETTSQDTQRAATVLARHACDLILFAGGDGTARDVFTAVERTVPILGVPTGVKMHSGVFAVGTASAGRLAADFVLGTNTHITIEDAEVMDIDKAAHRDNRLSARLYGYARVPFERMLVQSAKAASGRDDDGTLEGLAAEIAREMEAGTAYVIGPGSTAKRILKHLSLDGTLLGVDLVRDGALVAPDATEADILRLAGDGPLSIVVGVIGGQGFVFGRGNQQIGAAVIERAGAAQIIVMAGERKLAGLGTGRLLVDTGDPRTDALLTGYRRVRTGPGRSTVMRFEAV